MSTSLQVASRTMPRRIPPFRLVAEPLTPEAEAAAGFQWAPTGVGTRHRIGGDPDDQPGIHAPACPSCGQSMTFYGQLDSIGDDFALADVGLAVVFVCFDCFEAAARVVST
jgi:hypothetical protein